mmetsp:Transcript_33437/g.73070  ORF Transcript_33437/g.73070 Transcript_33437/m.73070 type:complete len:260 (-) Transcript_33437:245-1024(-)
MVRPRSCQTSISFSRAASADSRSRRAASKCFGPCFDMFSACSRFSASMRTIAASSSVINGLSSVAVLVAALYAARNDASSASRAALRWVSRPSDNASTCSLEASSSIPVRRRLTMPCSCLRSSAASSSWTVVICRCQSEFSASSAAASSSAPQSSAAVEAAERVWLEISADRCSRSSPQCFSLDPRSSCNFFSLCISKFASSPAKPQPSVSACAWAKACSTETICTSTSALACNATSFLVCCAITFRLSSSISRALSFI